MAHDISSTNMPIKTALVFAAGFGRRMLPLTLTTPKPLIKFAGKALLDYSFDKLKAAGVTNVIINTHYLADQISEHASKRKDLNITVIHETPEILDTGGAIVNALPFLGDEEFFVLNSDTILLDNSENFLIRLAQNWYPEYMQALLLLVDRNDANGYDGNGDFALTNSYILKRGTDGTALNYIYSGAMIIKPDLFSNLEKKPFSIFRDYIFKEPKFNNQDGTLNGFFGIRHEGKWLHIGTPESLAKLEAEILL